MDIFKNMIYTSLGFISLSADRLIRLLDTLIYEQKISREEGKRIVEDFIQNSNSRSSLLEGQLSNFVNELFTKFAFPNLLDKSETNVVAVSPNGSSHNGSSPVKKTKISKLPKEEEA